MDPHWVSSIFTNAGCQSPSRTETGLSSSAAGSSAFASPSVSTSCARIKAFCRVS
ncbi:MAG: hypothetical protein LW832_03735 [Parachlamydia sp.]|nr:hypothetical protein [Parachlamydia sp.]